MLQIHDFAFMYQGKIIRPLSEQEANCLLPIDHTITTRHDHALLLLHGFSSSPATYRAILPHLKGYDRIVCPVLPGHGESIQAFSQATAQDWRNTAYDCCASLATSYAKISIVGLSLGGALALELAQYFSLTHLYLLAPALKLYYSPKWAYWTARLLQMLGCKSLRNVSGNLLSDQYQELTYRHLPMPAILAILSFIQSQSYSHPNCSTDLFLGRYDKVIDCKTIAEHYADQTNVRIHWLEHSAHVLTLDSDRDKILACINQIDCQT